MDKKLPGGAGKGWCGGCVGGCSKCGALGGTAGWLAAGVSGAAGGAPGAAGDAPPTCRWLRSVTSSELRLSSRRCRCTASFDDDASEGHYNSMNLASNLLIFFSLQSLHLHIVLISHYDFLCNHCVLPLMAYGTETWSHNNTTIAIAVLLDN